MRVLVLDKQKRPLMPCSAYRARELLKQGKAKVYRRYPFTIILTQREGGNLQESELKIDPGSKTTGLAILAHFQRGYVVIWASNLKHRGQKIQESLEKRRSIRRNRRNRKTRYRKARFANRVRKQGWLSPSATSRVQNVYSWAAKLQALAPLSQIAVETVRFDTQKLQNAEIAGTEYQQGELFGYEVREYLLEKWHRRCAYCDRENVPLEIEHIVAKTQGGTERISNLTIACRRCNQKKGAKDIGEFLAKEQKRLSKILRQAKAPLKDAAALNTIRYCLGNALKGLGLPVSFASGGRTKYNRTKQGYPKEHWIDAACVGESGEKVVIPLGLKALSIQASGRGTRQMCRVDKYGFARTTAKQCKQISGFQTGDMVKAIVSSGKKVGTYIGRLAIRSNGYFNISTNAGVVQGISYRDCHLLQRFDGYSYS